MKRVSFFPSLAALGAGLFSLAALPSAASAGLFFTQGSATTSLDALKKANLDGSSVSVLANDAANFSQPKGIAVDSTNGYVYVADALVGGGGIIRYNLNGTGRTVVIPATASAIYNDVAVAGSKIYFVQGSATTSLDALKSANLDGSNVTTLASDAANFAQPGGVAVDVGAGYIYVADALVGGGGIIRFNLNGSGRTVVVAPTASSIYNDVAVAGSKIYFTQGSATTSLDALKSANLDGSGLVTLASDAANFAQPGGLAVDPSAGYIYVADASAAVAAQGILRFNLGGGGRTVLIGPTSGSLYNDVSLEGGDVVPGVPSVPDLSTASDTGASGTDNITNDSTPTFTGTAESGSTVAILRNGVSVGSGVATGGNYSVTTSSLADGAYSITATATNLAGTSAASSALAVTIDAAAPTITIGAPSTSLTRSGPVSYTVSYAGQDTVSLGSANVTVNTTGTASAGGVSVSGTGSTRTITLSSIAGNGSLGISVAAGTAGDTAGNLAAAAGPATTFVVDNAAPAITSATTASGTYDVSFGYTITASGSPVSFAASGLPPGLSVNPVSGVIDGVPTQAGSFSVTISATDAAGNIGSATLGLGIAKATATVNLGGLSQTYSGGARVATATTSPGGLTVHFTYDGSGSAPTNAGTYVVVGTISDANYQGEASGTLTVAPVALLVSADNKIRPYGYANPTLTASISGFVGGDTSAVLSGAPALSTPASTASNPGAYAISASIGTLSAANYGFNFADGTLTVRKLVYDDWRLENFSGAELSEPGVSGALADPDSDGLANLIEFAFGTNPRSGASGPPSLSYVGSLAGGGALSTYGNPILVFAPSGTGTELRALFLRRASAFTEGITYAGQFGADLATWENVAESPTVLATDGLYEVVSVPCPVSVAAEKTRFFRVNAEITE